MSRKDEALPRFDQIEGAPHPSLSGQLFGQDQAQQELLAAFNSQRMHHGWLVKGPKGIGKASLIWKFAKFLRASPASKDTLGLFGDVPDVALSMEIDPEHPVSRRVAAQSEPGIFSITRGFDEKRKRFRQNISVDDVRHLKSFFSMSSADGGRRVVIVDCAEDMNANAANAVLKVLEEPPKDTFLFLISHQPAQLLPTIRSRCRTIDLAPLSVVDLEKALRSLDIDLEGLRESERSHLMLLSNGSVGEAIRFLNLNGLFHYQMVLEILEGLPRLDTHKVMALSEKLSGQANSREYDVFLAVLERIMNSVVTHNLRQGADKIDVSDQEKSVYSRLSSSPKSAQIWADTAQKVAQRTRQGQSVNLDPAALILDTFLKIETCAIQCATA